MEEKELTVKVMDALCDIAFSGSGNAQQVRCLELLAKVLGLQEQGGGDGGVTIVEDL